MLFALGFYFGGAFASAALRLQLPLNRGWVGDLLLCSLTWPIPAVRMLFNTWRNR